LESLRIPPVLPSVVGSVTAALLAYQAYQFDERVLRLWRTTFSKSDGPLVSRPRDGTDIRHRQRGAQTAHAISALMRANEFIVMSHHTFVLNELAKLRASVRSVAETSRTTCAFCAGLAAGGDGPSDHMGRPRARKRVRRSVASCARISQVRCAPSSAPLYCRMVRRDKRHPSRWPSERCPISSRPVGSDEAR